MMRAAREMMIGFAFILVIIICLFSFCNDSWVISDNPFGSVAPSPSGSFPHLASRLSFGTCFSISYYQYIILKFLNNVC